ncbi:hypothetical protein DR999_PMT20183 [Platysternon megacephalum]|uniref:Uncharacterized protein n=1 Tax=Platysternon megacephalum TaxID=55544 RepID=A0A4D9DLW0_9SAUR|nr:hypothetical protein DR999_PMT20183 [Platysternon megacephalum]
MAPLAPAPSRPLPAGAPPRAEVWMVAMARRCGDPPLPGERAGERRRAARLLPTAAGLLKLHSPRLAGSSAQLSSVTVADCREGGVAS